MRSKTRMKEMLFSAWVVMILVLASLSGSAQVESPIETAGPHPIVSDEIYNAVLDEIFPRKWNDDKKTDWSLTLRFKPYSGPESQIVIRKLVDKVELNDYRAEQIAFNRINVWKESHGKEDIEQMSKLVDVKLKSASISRSQANAWLRAFFAAANDSNRMFRRQAGELDRTGSWKMRLHGAYYEIWFRRAGSELFMSIRDRDLGSTITGDSVLARWMNSIRLQTKMIISKSR